MPGNTKAVALDVNGTPAPQHYDPVQDLFDYSGGAGGIPAFRPAPEASSKFTCLPAESPALGAFLSVKATPGVLFALTVTNTDASPHYVLVFDSAAATPAGLNNPRLVFIVQPSTTQHLVVGGGFGKFFSLGILVGCSTTVPAYTATGNTNWIMAAAV